MDERLSKWIYTNVGLNKNVFISAFPKYLGNLPYDIYTFPMMFAVLIYAWPQTFFLEKCME